MVEDRTSPDDPRTAPDEIKHATSTDGGNGETDSTPVRPRAAKKAKTDSTRAATPEAAGQPVTPQTTEESPAPADPTQSEVETPGPNGTVADSVAPSAPDVTSEAPVTQTLSSPAPPGDATQLAPTTDGAEATAAKDDAENTAATGKPEGTVAKDTAKSTAKDKAKSTASIEDGPDAAKDAKDSGDFAKQLEASDTEPRQVKIGERVRGKIVSIGAEHCFVDYKGRAEARIATSELRDRDGSVLMRVDDMLTATVADVENGVTLTLGKRRGPVNAARLRISYENKVPVSGTVKSINKGGFDVSVGGIRAFCPLSQVDTTFVDNPQEYVGKKFRFRVLRWENGGRNIVVSRRPILREESKQRASETRKLLAEGAELDGVVTRLQPFGAFVDIGGLEGLLHVSRMGHTRVDDPTSVVSKGDNVRVRVVSIENPGTRKERIALALVDLGPDPWATVLDTIKVGDVLTGTVARLVPFGVFVRLPNGMDGLVHISELSDNRVNEANEAVKQGQEVQVRVLQIDVDKRRISLSLRLTAERPERKPKPRREPRAGRNAPSQPKTAPTDGGPVSLTHTMADQLGRLKNKLRDKG